jgi:hypothetical protein
MGEVYIALERSPERRVALKLINPAFADDDVFRQRFLREATAAAAIEHPHILPVYAAGEADGTLFMAMRLVDGLDLRQILRTSPNLPVDRVARIVGQIGGAGATILQFLMTVIICAVLYTTGETAARGVRKFATRLAGSNGDRAALLGSGAIRGVAMGIVVTALVQVLIAGAGLLIASVPAAPLLCAAILFLCLAQLGPGLIMVPAVIWEFSTGTTLSAWQRLPGLVAQLSELDNELYDLLAAPLMRDSRLSAPFSVFRSRGSKRSVIDLLGRLAAERNMAVLFISHDLLSMADFCHRIAILQEGSIAEVGTTDQIFTAPRHSYSQRLVEAAFRR